MRVAFLGTPEFAVPSLRALIESTYHVAAVFTQPDRPAGRGQGLHASPVKVLAREAGIPVHQPERIRDEENRPVIERLGVDFIVVVAYGQILPGWFLKAARIAPVNVHASLLPQYRGAAPIVWAILNGEAFTGVTTMWMDEHMDTGDMLLSAAFPISETMTAGELTRELARIGAGILIPTLNGLRDGTLKPRPQDHSMATSAPRIRKEMARVSWEKTAREVHNLVRAFNPWPLAFADFRGARLQILRTLPAADTRSEGEVPGTIVGIRGEALRVQCGGGTVLDLLEVQLAGKKPVSGKAFANGARLRAGELITEPRS
ncbi:MAG: methionyl-tRNA formyltransferase [Acidobacteria bacterium]|nr:methionyl-tRNA formyltransferase [Acidobacteriota bacterium]